MSESESESDFGCTGTGASSPNVCLAIVQFGGKHEWSIKIDHVLRY